MKYRFVLLSNPTLARSGNTIILFHFQYIKWVYATDKSYNHFSTINYPMTRFYVTLGNFWHSQVTLDIKNPYLQLVGVYLVFHY